MRRVYSLPYRRFMASSFAQLVIPLSGLALKPMESRRKDPRRVPYLGRQEGKKRSESSSRSVHRVAVIFDDESREWKSERGAPPTPHHRDPRGLGGGACGESIETTRFDSGRGAEKVEAAAVGARSVAYHGASQDSHFLLCPGGGGVSPKRRPSVFSLVPSDQNPGPDFVPYVDLCFVAAPAVLLAPEARARKPLADHDMCLPFRMG